MSKIPPPLKNRNSHLKEHLKMTSTQITEAYVDNAISEALSRQHSLLESTISKVVGQAVVKLNVMHIDTKLYNH